MATNSGHYPRQGRLPRDDHQLIPSSEYTEITHTGSRYEYHLNSSCYINKYLLILHFIFGIVEESRILEFVMLLSQIY